MMMRSAEECEISRSCHSATFSNPACAFDRTTRASPETCSQVTGLRLCGMADEPFCFSLKYSSASRTSVRCRWRISVAILSSLDAITASAVSYTHLRAHETRHDLVCRLL